jgi:hypothetical protein
LMYIYLNCISRFGVNKVVVQQLILGTLADLPTSIKLMSKVTKHAFGIEVAPYRSSRQIPIEFKLLPNPLRF